MPLTRSVLAAMFRAMPDTGRKYRVARRLTHMLSDYTQDASSLVTFTMRDGSRMRVDLRSNAEFYAYWSGRYEQQTMDLLARCIVPGGVVFDVGANVGFYSVALGRKLQQSGGSLYAFEPVPSNFARLTELVTLNDLQDTVHILNVALGNSEGTVSLALEKPNGAVTGNAVIVGMGFDDLEANVSAPLTRLTTIVEKENIPNCHVIKIDVEGAELAFLQGAIKFLQVCTPIICMEFNRPCMNAFGYSFADVKDLLCPLGYRFYRFEDRSSLEEATGLNAELENILLVPSSAPPEVLARLGI